MVKTLIGFWCRRAKLKNFPYILVLNLRKSTAFPEISGNIPRKKLHKTRKNWQWGFWKFILKEKSLPARHTKTRNTCSASSKTYLIIWKRKTRKKLLRKCMKIWKEINRWTGLYAGMSDSARPKWRCEPLSRPYILANKSPFFARPRFYPTSISQHSLKDLKNSLSISRCFPDLKTRKINKK